MSNEEYFTSEPRGSRGQISTNDRELISATETLKLFTFTKSTGFDPQREEERNCRLPTSNRVDIHHHSTEPTERVLNLEKQIDPSELAKMIGGDTPPTSSQNADNSSPSSRNPTVNELLKMLTRKGNSSSSSKPPPVPPKPKACIDSSSVSFAERGFRRYFQSTKINLNSSVADGSEKFDAYESSMQRETNDRDYNNPREPTYQLSQNSPSSAKHSHLLQQPSERFLHDLTSSTAKETLLISDRINNNNGSEAVCGVGGRSGGGGSGDDGVGIGNKNHSIIQPIVTESPEEANNNNIERLNRPINTSTVEILEIPFKHNTPKTHHGNNCNNTTFSRSQKQQLFYENNSYAAPVVTSATDDEDEDQSDNDVALPTEMEVESILNESSNEHPPRTSTPNESKRRHLNSSSSTDTSLTETNNKITTTNNIRPDPTINLIQTQEADLDEDNDEDTVNISRDTDELTNTSAFNQSGCELVGIYETSDAANNSKDSPNNSGEREKMPYTVQVFNETTMSSAVSPSGTSSRRDKSHLYHQNSTEQHSPCKEKIQELEGLTNSLQEYVEKLKTQVVGLTSKVSELETQVSKQQDDVKRLNETSNLSLLNISARHQQDSFSSPVNHGLSQSTSTLNRQISHAGEQQSPMSTYSRNHVATISHNSIASPGYSSNGQMSTSLNVNNNTTTRYASSQSCNNTVTKPIKRANIHASTNSLHPESQKLASSSISPTPTHYQHHRQSTSPTSLMNTLSNRRDPTAYTSMLSLCSTGGGSTLKKASAASGSVSNLSQVGSQLLTNWPSISDFVANKHRGKSIHYSEEERLIRMMLYNTLITMRLPNWVESDYDLDKVVQAPIVRMKLDWVYGYRGRDCRTNIFYLPTGECVYFVASIIVLYNPDAKTQRHYLGHTDNVKCLTVHPNKLIIASGQASVQNRRDKRPIVRVWNTVSLATLRIIEFNEDFDRSICCLAFSKHDQGATLAVVDESNEHTITLLDWQKERNWRIAEANSGHEPVLAIDFHPIDKYSLVAVGKANINFWDIRGLTLTKKAGLFDKYDRPKYVLCLTFNDFGDTITGDSNGNLIIWPRGSNRPKKVIHDVHQGGVFSVLAMKDGSYLTGGRDRRVVEWNENFVQTGREAELPEHCGGIRYITYARGAQVLIGTLRNSILLGSLDTNFELIMQGHAEATSSLATHPNQDQFLTGGFDDQIRVFQAGTHELVWSKCLMMPVTSASFSPNGFLLVVGSTLGKWLVLDAITQEILFTKCDGSGTICCVKFSPDGEFFAMGSTDSQIYIYQTTEAGNKFCRLGTCVGHSAPIKEMDWTDDSRYLQTQSMNFELLFWRAKDCRPLEDTDIIDNLRWFTYNCTIGFSVIGIWSDTIDSALINYCDKSSNDDLMVSITDTGNIDFFKWPPCYNQSSSQRHPNGEKFNVIKFLHDDSRLIAIGTKNCVTTEWIVDKGDNL